ncbi:MAG: DUF4012 domain-containing protein [Actinobacteria bacterium]|nr:DUF4012 domain-containing protein [Actinomycetota bacterium]
MGPAEFRILVVCTGNVCRSPLAERLIRSWLTALPGDHAGRFAVTSAGTRGLVGRAMDPRSARVCEVFGASAEGFTGRALDVGQLLTADLVLTAGREHRAEAVRRCPAVHPRVFTIREFGRLVAAIPAAELPATTDPVERARLLVEAARSRRGTARATDPAEDDVIDPTGDVEELYHSVGHAIAEALAGPVGVLRGTPVTVSAPDRAAPDLGTAGTTAGRRRWPWAVAATLAGLAVAGGWLTVRGIQARQELAGARAEISVLRTALLSGQPDRARTLLVDVQHRTGRARALTDDPVWRLVASAPYLGDTPRAVRTLAAAADELAQQPLPALVDAGTALAPGRLRSGGDRIAVAAFAASQPTLDAAAQQLVAIQRQVADLPTGWVPAGVTQAAAALAAEIGVAHDQIATAGRAVRLAAGMLGADGPRRYLLVLQNNAEARGTGGLPGMYAVIGVDRGTVTVQRIGSDTDLRSASRMPVDLGREFAAQWGEDPALWPNSNLDPQFPYAARIWLALWQRQTGQRLDGAIATDPIAVSYLLGVTGPARLPGGEAVRGEDLVGLTMRAVYARYPDPAEQDAYLRQVAASTLRSVLSGRGEPRVLLTQIDRAVRERRILIYSTHPAEQQDLLGTALGGGLPDATGPYAFLVVNNVAANKMDYYLRRSVDYAAGRCSAGQRESRIVLRLGNAAAPTAPLPAYAAQRGDTMGATLQQSALPGAVAVWASVYGARGARLVAATMDGRALAVAPAVASGHPVWSFPLVVRPGQQRIVVLHLVEPARPGESVVPVVPVQPLVQPQRVTVSVLPCG